MERAAYAQAGVDVGAGERAVDLLRRRLAASNPDLLGGLGGFAAALALPEGYRQPVLLSATDGVGTKTEISRALDRLETIGRDLVAMCADDVVCHGAQPTFFLDYIALGRLVPERVERLVGGVAEACTEIGCTLVGGETAEHPGLLEPDAFDLAGFCVGLVEREQLIDGRSTRAGDVLIGMASSGLHANGYSLVRALLARHELSLSEPYAALLDRHGVAGAPGDGRRLGDELLTPTRLYTPAVLALRDRLTQGGLRLAALLHVTGGGLPGNLPRLLPSDLGIVLRVASWPMPPVFALLGQLARLEPAELRATFNCGIGMAAIVEPAAVEASLDCLRGQGIEAWSIGEVHERDELGGRTYVESA